MKELQLKTKDLKKENIRKLTKLFPQLITEVEKDGEIIKTINRDSLKELVGDYADNDREIYHLNWVGKQKSKEKIMQSINKTLRPCKEESVDFENTENLYIEGDNFEVLKLLQNAYLNKVKMIYIDPPYNTGKDFIYKDKRYMNKEDYEQESESIDEEGKKLYKNTITNGRFHSDWLSMMYERLIIARDLLKDDGVIFISIDDNEVHNLKLLCDEIFGESDFVSNLVWEKVRIRKNSSKYFTESHEHILCYTKNKENWNRNLIPRKDTSGYKNPDKDSRGNWIPVPIHANHKYDANYEITKPNGVVLGRPKNNSWRLSEANFKRHVAENRIWWGKKDSYPMIKKFLSEVQKGLVPKTILYYDEVGGGPHGDKVLKDIFDGNKFFENPKSVDLIKTFLQISTNKNKNDIILDFFSGSATTAHAVMKLNAEDGGNRKFIMVQLKEKTDEKSEAYKAGYKNICEIGKERIRRAGKQVKEELIKKAEQPEIGKDPINPDNLDIGFKVFKIDSTNMKDVFYNPKDLTQELVSELEVNIKEDRTELDILYQVLIDLAIPIDAKIQEEEINNRNIYKVGDNFLIACFSDNIDLDTVKYIVKLKPLNLVFKDLSFKDDATKINIYEYIKNNLPNTRVRVI